MRERRYKDILKFFQKISKIEIDRAVMAFRADMSYRADEKKKKLIVDAYGQKIANALDFILTLSKQDKKNIETILQLYTSESFRYFFKRLEEGENIEIGERINFELTAVNEETGQRTKLISANPDEDNIDNNFQEWILDNCSKIQDE